MTQQKIKSNQIWKSKDSNKYIVILNRNSGNKHWNTTGINRKKTHKIHEGTLLKYYELLEY